MQLLKAIGKEQAGVEQHLNKNLEPQKGLRIFTQIRELRLCSGNLQILTNTAI